MEREDKPAEASASSGVRARVGRLLDLAAWGLLAVVLWRFLGPQGSADLAGVRGVRGTLDLPPGRPAVIEVASHT
ncbi:MAG: hypothetical protein VKO21_07045 [Candidatus Sericytochromatia bacterium]|nr:hypothetical protein [Candidatus Sericytochromatia bacterium]